MPKFSVIGELGLDGSGWEKTLRVAGTQMEGFATKSVGMLKNQLAGLFTLGAIEETIRRTAAYIENIKDMARQTGLATDEVQRLTYAAKESGLEFADFQTALSHMGVARKEAAEKNDELLRTFERFGVTLRDLQNPALQNIDLLKKMAQAIQGVTLSAQDREALREFFGRGGEKLAEAISTVDSFRDRPIVSEKDIESIDRLEKAVERLKTTAMVEAAPVLGAAADDVSNRIKSKGSLAATVMEILANNPVQYGADALSIFHKAGKTGAGSSGAGSSSSSTVSGIAQSGTLFEDQRKVALEEKELELNELILKNHMNLLGVTQKRKILQEEINRLANDAQTFSDAGLDKAAVLARIQREQKITEMQALDKGKIHSDSLSAVGNFLGKSGRDISQISEALHRKAIDSNTKKLDDLTKAMNGVAAGLRHFGINTGFGVPPT